MKWYKFWTKRSGRESGRKDSVASHFLDVDFFCLLSYMAAIATSGISRSGLFYRASKLPYVSARYFKKIDFVAKAFNHDYAEACIIVGQATKELDVKALLLRLSGALSSGEDIPTFLERESEVFSEAYGNRYERRLEVLRKWTDAYVALIMTSAIIIVMAVVTLMIGNATAVFILFLAALTIVITATGAWLLYRAAPKETKVHSLPYRSREQDLARNVAKFTLPAGAVVVLSLLVMKFGLGWSLLAASFFLFPLGLISWLDDRKINKRDVDIAGFLRSLGGVSQAIGATVNEAMGRLDFRSLGSLRENVSLLFTRLRAGIEPALCWLRFVGETGSEQVNRSVRIFWDGVTIGGEPQRVGNDASSFATKIALLRTHRGLIASGLLWLTITMHVVLTMLLLFIYQTLVTFTGLIQTIAPGEAEMEITGLPTFGIFSSDTATLNLLYFMIIVIVLVLTLANSFAIYATSGGHIYKLAFYLAILMSISGAVLLSVPNIVNLIFTTMM